mmetsp:Transcript_20416/g.65766  ORF Transcript_20416/g.65766 Transcript_20416/m.65766 type:complete len:269 (-) Transcript_20416:107-913(-)
MPATNDSSQVGALLFGLEKRGRRRSSSRNFLKENKKLVKEISATTTSTTTEDLPERLSHLKEFSAVKARCFDVKVGEARHEYLRKNAREDQPRPVDLRVVPETTTTTCEIPVVSKKAPLPDFSRRRNDEETTPEKKVDFLERNKHTLSSSKRRTTPTPRPRGGSSPVHEDFGALPAYLVKRKLELAEQKKPKPEEGPPGTRKMDEKERLKMVATLKEQQKKATEALDAMPLALTTLKQKKKKKDLEDKLTHLASSLAIFEKPQVFIKI